ncbi:hypothetical protein [Aquisphaera insulae]|uniref:hypothetical protein n=1 Tax=Aquisphaera insulae TaxID=2712864 RepID=UPI0013EA56BF|nr:hypothetical protein [Aquisphaera insulae]
MMTQEEDPADPLLAAIGTLRRELVGWIDSRLDLLRKEQAAGHRADAQSERIAVRTPTVDGGVQARTQVAPAAPQTGDDPRLRLDALARHLGERLRFAEPIPEGGRDGDREKSAG